MARVAEAAQQTLPAETAGLDWERITYQESIAGSQIYWAFGLSLILAYLLLAAQYESWFLPVAVVLSVPATFVAMHGIEGRWKARKTVRARHPDF